MSLPNITIPFELPVDISVLIHPAVVHFVIAIPIVIFLIEIINLGFKKRALSVLSLFLMVVVAVAMSVAYFTGTVDCKEAYSLLTSEGQAELKEHKLLGIYLVYGSVVMILLKLLFMALSKTVARLFFIVLLMGFIAITLKQGKDGGELVYEHGANNKAVSAIEEKLDDLQDEYDELKEKSKKASKNSEVEAKLKELQEKYDALLKSSEESSAKNKEEATTVSETEETEVAVKKTDSQSEENTTEVSSSDVKLEIPSDSNGSSI
jgi:uncharacterized membrane protein